MLSEVSRGKVISCLQFLRKLNNVKESACVCVRAHTRTRPCRKMKNMRKVNVNPREIWVRVI